MNNNEVYSIENYLREKKNITYTFSGVSMKPILRQERDLYTLRKKKDGERLPLNIILNRICGRWEI